MYQVSTNQKINAILMKVKETYPNITKNELIEILVAPKEEDNFVWEYGIDLKRESMILENDKTWMFQFSVFVVFFFAFTFFLIKQFLNYNKKKGAEIENITKMIMQINQKNYELDMNFISEDELSILKHEIYKTTVMLKEQAENSIQDKKNLKNSLSDISHQLKTPLASILILLDNIIENPNMDQKKLEEFIHNIKREIMKIRFLVETILKLAQLESNTILFMKENVSIHQLLLEAIENVKPLCDYKKVEIIISHTLDGMILCDKKWQIEALTNILKNSVEYSLPGNVVKIDYKITKLYVEITIKNYGSKIEADELPHIFDRFYKGKNSEKDSIGIGLSLAKSIIESNNGIIYVKSNEKETVFIIRYFYHETI